MAAKKKIVSHDPTRTHCCSHMKQVEEYASSRAVGSRVLAGIQVAHVFNKETGKHTWSPTVYVLPARGRGMDKIHQTTMLVPILPILRHEAERKRESLMSEEKIEWPNGTVEISERGTLLHMDVSSAYPFVMPPPRTFIVREPGYYWVLVDGELRIAEWREYPDAAKFQIRCWWSLPGSSTGYTDAGLTILSGPISPVGFMGAGRV